jgi:hypothetical protein
MLESPRNREENVMRVTSRLGALFVLASALAFAETWTGKLLDANCASKGATSESTMEACTPTSSTSSFVLEVSNKKYTLDQEGNKKAVAAFKESQSGAERAKDPEQYSGITATVNGSLRGEEIQVTSIKVH